MQIPPAAITHIVMLAGITPRPMDSKPETSPASPRPVSRKPRKSSGKLISSRMLGMYQVTSMKPMRADRHVDEENPAPRIVRHDEAADRRPDHRTQHRGHGQIRHRGDQLGFGDGLQNDQAADRDHHGAAEALQNTRGDQLRQRLRQSAEHRASREDDDRGAEDRARAESIRHPSADRNEDGEAQQVGGDREVELDRILAERLGHRGQRGRDDRRSRASP